MLLLLFRMGKERYALDASQVIEVVPLAELKTVPKAPAYVAGVLNYRGHPVPVIDLSQLNLGRASEVCMSTRIVLVPYGAGAADAHMLGLVAEHVTETVKMAPGVFTDPGIAVPDAPYLGDVANDQDGMLQLMDVQRLLPAGAAQFLFTHAVEA